MAPRQVNNRLVIAVVGIVAAVILAVTGVVKGEHALLLIMGVLAAYGAIKYKSS